jgi:hypothetical protein
LGEPGDESVEAGEVPCVKLKRRGFAISAVIYFEKTKLEKKMRTGFARFKPLFAKFKWADAHPGGDHPLGSPAALIYRS